MAGIKIFLPKALKEFVDEQVAERGYGSTSEYLRELIRREQDRQQMRGRLLGGGASKLRGPPDPAYFAALRGRLRRIAKEGGPE